MEAPRTLKKNLKKQIKTATEEEKRGLHELWRGLKARHSALSRAETARKRRSHKKKRTRNASSKTHTSSHDNSSSNQDQVPCQHKKKTYSDSDREIPLSESAGLVWPATPGEKFNNNPPKIGRNQSSCAKSKSQISSRAQWCAISTLQNMPKYSKTVAQNSTRSMEQPEDR